MPRTESLRKSARPISGAVRSSTVAPGEIAFSCSSAKQDEGQSSHRQDGGDMAFNTTRPAPASELLKNGCHSSIRNSCRSCSVFALISRVSSDVLPGVQLKSQSAP